MKDIIQLPLIPLRGLSVFPNMVLHFDLGREKSIAALEAGMKNNEEIFAVPQVDPDIDEPTTEDIRKIGTVCKVKQIVKISNDNIKVLVEGEYIGKIEKYIDNDNYFEAYIERIKEEEYEDDLEVKAYFNILKKAFINFIKEAGEGTPELIKNIKMETDVNDFVNMVSSFTPIDDDKKIEILESLDIKKKIELLLECLQNEQSIIKVQKKLSNKMKKKVNGSQKEYYLREQIKLIQEELGEDDEETRIVKEYEEKINKLSAPQEVKKKAQYELKRLKGMSPTTTEGASIQSYLDWLLDVPWNKKTKEEVDLNKVRKILDEDHYGLDEVKDRIIEFLAAKKFSGSLKGPIICLVGPPGVGKTSIARSIARAINRKFVRMSLGGIRDEAEIRGHRRTYVAAIPGRIIYSLKEAKAMNPLLLLDEIDKIGSDVKGNPADALLEILDSEENKAFRDNFLELSVDLSNVLFMTTANSLDTIPRPLLDRMEIIEVSGYTYEEKFHIAKEHLIKRLQKEYKYTDEQLKISDSSINEVINGYTRESGVRNLERTLASLVRKSLAELLKKNKASILVNTKKVHQLLGAPRYEFDESDNEDKIGVVTGLAWTAYGGDTLPVEVMVMKGTGKLELTGQLGSVMQESAKAAYSFVRANYLKYDIDEKFYKECDIHIHVPEGAVPKDGPSAGVTMVTALVSALSKKKVKGNLAMTGEVTLTGKVLPIGGLKEKSLAAYRAGIKTIIIPKDNAKDVEKIPATIRNKINIIEASHVSTVLSNALVSEEKNEN
ncbi:MAG: endopeptidase La [Clostridium sp.]|nr:endopeptidase La [Clostridium sp.]MDY3827736.1 endopeptidase La [Clostridium sp.]